MTSSSTNISSIITSPSTATVASTGMDITEHTSNSSAASAAPASLVGQTAIAAPAAAGATKERKGRFTIHRNMLAGNGVNGGIAGSNGDSLESLPSVSSVATHVVANGNGQIVSTSALIVPQLSSVEQQDIVVNARVNENVSPLSIPCTSTLSLEQGDSVSVSGPQQQVASEPGTIVLSTANGNTNIKNSNLHISNSTSPPPSAPVSQQTQSIAATTVINKPPIPPPPPSSIAQQSQSSQPNLVSSSTPIKSDNSIPPLPPKVAIKGRFKLSTELPLTQQPTAPDIPGGKDDVLVPTQSQLFRRGQSFSVDGGSSESRPIPVTNHPHRRVASVDTFQTQSNVVSQHGDANMRKFSLADRCVMNSNCGEGKIFNAGKLFYFLEQMKAEIAEADKMNRAVSSDSKLVRSINKDLEKKCRDLERRLQEEQALRLAAEAKVKQLRKKLRDFAATTAVETGNSDTVQSQDSYIMTNSEGLENQRNTSDNTECNRLIKGNSSDSASISDSLDKCFGENQLNTAIPDKNCTRPLSPPPPRSRVHSASSSEGDPHKRSPINKPILRSELRSLECCSSDEDVGGTRSRHTSRDFDPLFSIADNDASNSSPKLISLPSSMSQPNCANTVQLQMPNPVGVPQQHTSLQPQSLSMNSLSSSVSQMSLNSYQQIQLQQQFIGQQQYLTQQQQQQQQYQQHIHQDPFDALAMRQVPQQPIQQQQMNLNSQVSHHNQMKGV